VIDETGAPVESVALDFRPRGTVFRAAGLHSWAPEESHWSTASDRDGGFQLARIAGGAAGILHARAAGFREREVELPETSELGLVVTLERFARAVELAGTVLAPDGRPLPGASVSAGRDIVTTDARGRFNLPWTGGTGRFVKDASGAWREEGADVAAVIALKKGFRPAREALHERDLELPFVLRLGPEPLAISGTIRDADGEPLAGLVLWIQDPTRFGREPTTTDDGSEWHDERWVEAHLGGAKARSDGDGRFEIGGLMEREYAVLASDPRTAARAGPWTIVAGSSGLELVLPPEPTARVAGRIVTARGTPRAGWRVEARRSGSWETGAEAPQLTGAEHGVETDSDGRFEFAELATTGTALFYSGAFTFGEIALADQPDLGRIEIVEPELCEVQVELVDPSSADRVEALDANGEHLETVELTGVDRGMMLSLGFSAEIVDGRTRLLLVKETARTLVLSKGELEVLRIPIELVPGERALLRL
jgi:hypothetical protein